MIGSPGTMSCPVKSVVVPEKLAMTSPGIIRVPARFVDVPVRIPTFKAVVNIA